MKKTLGLWLSALAIALPTQAQLDTAWTRTCGGAGNDGFRSVVRASDGGFLAVGYTYSYGAGDADVYAVKIDENGNPVWTKTYGGSGRDYGFGVCPTADGGFAITGYTTSRGAGAEDVYLVRTDGDGDTLWTRTYGGTDGDEGRSIAEAPDGSLVIVGQTKSYGAGETDVYVIRAGAAGDTIWTRTHGDSLLDYGRGVCITADQNYGIAASVRYASDNLDLLVAEIDTGGTMLWTKIMGDLGPINPEWATAAVAEPDSGIFAVGYRGIEGLDPSDIFIGKTDGAGNQQFWRRYSDPYYEYANAACLTHDDGYMICGMDKTVATQRNDLLLLKRVPGTGWAFAQTLGGAGSDWGSSILEVRSGAFLVAGHTDSFGAGGFDGWLVWFQDPAVAVPEAEEHGSLFLSPARPNPGRNGVFFTVNLPRPENLELRVLDVAGKSVRSLHRGSLGAGVREFEWDLRNDRGREVASGVYFIVADGAVHGSRRTVVLR